MDAPKVVMITGVSSGFGRAMAVKLASQGHKVYGTVRREVEALPGVTYVQAEVQDEASVAAAVVTDVWRHMRPALPSHGCAAKLDWIRMRPVVRRCAVKATHVR